MPATYPLLESISAPRDLRTLHREQLPQLCEEIRSFLIQNLSKTPGHFASSMGAVELIVALHYVFRTPYDRLVWDVGHQAYAHKLLTGRLNEFHTLRQWGGLAGFTSPDESPYDTFPAGHASNSISAALGMAVASQLKGEHRHVVAVIGDGALTGGLAFEGLNNAATMPNNLLIVLNDNNISIDANVGGINKYMVDLNTSRAYNAMRYDLYRGLKQIRLVNDAKRRRILRFNNSVKSLIQQSTPLFENFGIRSFGPIDGHNIERIISILNRIKNLQGPKILHIRTTKGKGYAPAEQNPIVWHAPGKFDPQTGKQIKSTHTTPQPPKFQEVFGHTVTELAQKDARVVGITPAMPSGSSLNIMMKALPNRAYDVGIAEEHAVTFSGGLAQEGLVPFCSLYSSFLQRAYDQIVHDVSLPNYHVVFCIDRAGLVGEDGATHQGLLDIPILRTVPNLKLSAPMNEHYLRHLMRTALEGQSGPMAIRYPRGTGSQPHWRVDPQLLPIGKGRCLHHGTEVAILTIGPVGVTVQHVMQRLEQEQIPLPGHYDMIFIKPIDKELLQQIFSQYKHIITIEDGNIAGGFGSLVAEEAADIHYQGSISRVGIPDQFVPHGHVDKQRNWCGLDEQGIYELLRSKFYPSLPEWKKQ